MKEYMPGSFQGNGYLVFLADELKPPQEIGFNDAKSSVWFPSEYLSSLQFRSPCDCDRWQSEEITGFS